MRLTSIGCAGALALVLSVGIIPATAALADAAPNKSRSYCRSTSGTKVLHLTAPLERAFARIAAKRHLGVSLLHVDRSLVCGANEGGIVGTASTSKPLIVATLFQQRARQHRKPTPTELALARRSIRSSDNDATHRLWRIIGGGIGLGRFARSVGLNDLTPTMTRNWGSTTLSASTLTAFSRLLITPGSRLGPDAAAFILGNMRLVAASQRWGISAGAGAGRVALKNGWYPSRTEGYRAHSFGIIDAGREHYLLSITSVRSRSFREGVSRVEWAASLVNTVIRRSRP